MTRDVTRVARRRFGAIWLLVAILLALIFGSLSAATGNWRFLLFASSLIVLGLAIFLASRLRL